MRYIILDDPLKPIIPAGFKGLTVPLNIAESKLRSPIGFKIELIDLSGTFDLGLKAEFSDGRLVGWRKIAVF